MKYIEKYLEEVIKIKPIGKVTVKDEYFSDLSGNMVYIDNHCSDIFISHADYSNWLEKKVEKIDYTCLFGDNNADNNVKITIENDDHDYDKEIKNALLNQIDILKYYGQHTFGGIDIDKVLYWIKKQK